MNKVLLFLTKAWLRLMKAKFIGVSEIKLPSGECQKVILFSSKEPLLLGQVTIFNTTIIHEGVFLSEKLLNYVIVHESAHKRQWYRYFIYPLVIIWFPGFFMLPLSLINIVRAVISSNSSELIVAIYTLLFSTIYFLIPFLYSWFLEFMADYQAIKELGSQYILEALSEFRSKRPQADLVSRILARMTHPPIEFTIAIYDFIKRRHSN